MSAQGTYRFYSVWRQTILLVKGVPLGRERVKAENMHYDNNLWTILPLVELCSFLNSAHFGSQIVVPVLIQIFLHVPTAQSLHYSYMFFFLHLIFSGARLPEATVEK